ncbi:MAG: hypothetical protein LBR89_04500 [Holosporales bacterium]|jgi:hypothetical protein|nr:hypothetical protein [Holosporales bacterium]
MNNLLKVLKVVTRLCFLFLVTMPTQASDINMMVSGCDLVDGRIVSRDVMAAADSIVHFPSDDWIFVRSVQIKDAVWFLKILSGEQELTDAVLSEIRGESFLWLAKHYNVDQRLIPRQICEKAARERAIREEAARDRARRHAGDEAPPSKWAKVLEDPDTHCRMVEDWRMLDFGHSTRVEVTYLEGGVQKSETLVVVTLDCNNKDKSDLQDLFDINTNNYKQCAADSNSQLAVTCHSVPPDEMGDCSAIYTLPFICTLADRSNNPEQQENIKQLDNPTRLAIILDMLTGISTLHEKGFFHGRLDPSCIFLYSPKDIHCMQRKIPTQYRARVAHCPVRTLLALNICSDRGSHSNNRYVSDDYYSIKDHYFYTLEYCNAQQKIDVFAACAIIYELVVGEPLLSPELGAHEIRRLTQRPIPIPRYWHKKSQDLILRGLDSNPWNRPSIGELLCCFAQNGLD